MEEKEILLNKKQLQPDEHQKPTGAHQLNLKNS